MRVGVKSPERALLFGSGTAGREVGEEDAEDDNSLSRFLDSALILDAMVGIRNMQIWSSKKPRTAWYKGERDPANQALERDRSTLDSPGGSHPFLSVIEGIRE